MSASRSTPDEAADRKRVALALASLVFGFAAPVAYTAQRLFERARSTPTDPLLVVFDLHTAFYWRASTAAWWGVVLAIVAYAFSVQPAAATLRARLTRGVTLAAVPLAIALALTLWRNP